MNKKISGYISVVGVALLFSTFLTMLVTFLVAYLSPTKSTMVYINMFHEADIELVLLAVITLMGGFSLLKGLKDIKIA